MSSNATVPTTLLQQKTQYWPPEWYCCRTLDTYLIQWKLSPVSSTTHFLEDICQKTTCNKWLFFCFTILSPYLHYIINKTTIYLVVGDIDSSSVLQCGLGALFDWSLKWHLNVTARKCVMLQLGHSHKHFKYDINNLVLPNVTESKTLAL